MCTPSLGPPYISVLFSSCEGIPKISCDERQRSSVKKYQRSALSKICFAEKLIIKSVQTANSLMIPDNGMVRYVASTQLVSCLTYTGT